ncbi:WYL domain-containing protein [Acidithiobacillus ferridurans]|uniref:helix-turn-helix transcriptional regulator n=1 Tax=Acidithiobacillus ferridurans TaxID=1232575 RepID=UPI001C07206B|nr:WYL domain-containing protein [Acidithiobacillus ferridurans]MBU2805636.1 WYL domain-containing protein [Acidithiobacillus ferridurans]
MSTRGGALDGALILLDVLRAIPRKRFVSARQIHATLREEGIDRDLRTIQRYLDLLTQHFPVERDERSRPYGYRWPEDARGISLPLLRPSEALLLALAQTELASQLPTELSKTLTPLFDQAQAHLGRVPEAAPAQRWLRKVRRIPERLPLLPAFIPPEIFETVSNALYHERKLQIVYRNAKGTSKDAVIWPLGLAQQGSRLYLVCRFEGYDNERILALPRIQKAQMLNAAFVYPSDFDLARYDGEGRFAFGQGERVRLQFSMERATAQHLLESPLSTDQEVEEYPDYLTITATVTNSALLQQWLLGFGSAIRNYQISPISQGGHETFTNSLSSRTVSGR